MEWIPAPLLWGLLAYGVLPLWLLAGLADYVIHARTDITHTSGSHESALHLLQTAEIGLPMLALLFLEVNAAVLAIMATGVVTHTLTAYRDLRYAAPLRRIPVVEQFVHSFLIVLPLAALALVAMLHWAAVRALWSPSGSPAGAWSLSWRATPFDPAVVMTVLGVSVLLGVVPGVVEFMRTLAVRRHPGASSRRQ